MLKFALNAGSNLSLLPLLTLAYRRKLLFHFYIGLLTFVASTLYHAQEALKVERILLSTRQWHQLDNIGAVTCWLAVLVHLMDNFDHEGEVYISRALAQADKHILYSGFLLTLLAQIRSPWTIFPTAFPILAISICLLYKVICVRKPRIHRETFKRGLYALAAAAGCFVLGLQETRDSLRVFHSLWHIFASLSIFHLFQSVDKSKSLPGLPLHLEPVQRLTLRQGILGGNKNISQF